MLKGYKHTEKTKKLMRLVSFLRDNTNRIKAIPKGKNHWNWDKQPNILTLHKRIHRRYGSAKKQKCGVVYCKNMAHDWANISGKYTDNILDYMPMCRSCHVKKDKNWIKKFKV